MNTQDILNIILILVLLTVLACAVFTTYYFIRMLKVVTKLASSLENTTQSLRDNLKFRALTAIPALLLSIVGKIIKRRG